jgi:hypothetical protein
VVGEFEDDQAAVRRLHPGGAINMKSPARNRRVIGAGLSRATKQDGTGGTWGIVLRASRPRPQLRGGFYVPLSQIGRSRKPR